MLRQTVIIFAAIINLTSCVGEVGSGKANSVVRTSDGVMDDESTVGANDAPDGDEASDHVSDRSRNPDDSEISDVDEAPDHVSDRSRNPDDSEISDVDDDVTAPSPPEPAGDSGDSDSSPQNHKPVGALETLADGVARGWACDQDTPNTSIEVHIYVGGPAGSGAAGYVVPADRSSEPAIAAKCLGGNAHRFKLAIPSWQASAGKAVYAYGIDTAGGHNPLLAGSPMSLPGTATAPSNPEPSPSDPDPATPAPPAANVAPLGHLDSVANGVAQGWACDPNQPKKSIQVHIYVGGPAGSGASGYPITADRSSEPAIAAKCLGGNAHRFKFAIPNWQASAGLPVYVYAIDTAGGPNPQLVGSPQAL